MKFDFSSPFWNFIFHYLAWSFWIFWVLFTIHYLYRASKKPEKINFYLFDSIPSVFVSIGLLGTFLGITSGLITFDTDSDKIKKSIKLLIDSLRLAFIISIAGIVGSLISSNFTNAFLHKHHLIQQPKSPEFFQLEEINRSLRALKITLLNIGSKQKANFETFVHEINWQSYLTRSKAQPFGNLTSFINLRYR